MQGDYGCIDFENPLANATAQKTLLAKFLYLVLHPSAFRSHRQENPAGFVGNRVH